MATTFPTAPTVAIGDKITSAQHNALAEAFRARLKSGLGDPAWRMWYKLFGLVRKPEENQEELTTPDDSWLWAYMLLDPVRDEATWANTANDAPPLLAFALGLNETSPEDVRLSLIPLASSGMTDLQYWEAAKEQRGCADPVSGWRQDYALYCASEHLRELRKLYFSSIHVHAVKWGGLMPLDEVSDEQIQYHLLPVQSGFSYVLRSTGDGWTASVDYEGLEPRYKFVSGGTTEYYPFSQYLLASYGQSGWQLTGEGNAGDIGSVSLQSNHISVWEELMRIYAADYRGSTAQRDAETPISVAGFDFQKFFSRQYAMAPQFGVYNELTEVVDPDIGTLTLAASAPVEALPEWIADHAYFNGEQVQYNGKCYEVSGASEEFGTALPPDEEGAPWIEITCPVPSEGCCGSGSIFIDLETDKEFYAAHTGYVLYGLKLTASSDLEGSIVVETFSASDEETWTSYSTIAIAPGETKVVWWDTKTTFPPQLQLRTQTPFSVGTVTAEVLEIEDRKPLIQDAYLVLRLMTAELEGTTLDHPGFATSTAKDLSDQYFAARCLVRDDGGIRPQTEENFILNPVYETARRWFKDRFRFLRWTDPSDNEMLIACNLEGAADTLTFRRYVTVSGVNLDLWEGIAPSLDPIPSGSLQYHRQYIVKTAAIEYNGSTLAADTVFSAVRGVDTFTGDGQVYEYEGIVTTAPPRGRTNEWILHLDSMCEGGTGFELVNWAALHGVCQNRCLMGAGGADPDFIHHVSPANRIDPLDTTMLDPESPRSHSYAGGANSTPSQNFNMACRIYEKPYVITSCKVDPDHANQVIVQLDRALDGWSEESTEWDDEADPYAPRSDLNLIADYLNDFTTIRPGDHNSSGGDHCTHGSYLPRFYLTKLPPKVWVDEPADNTIVDAEDTLATADDLAYMHWILDAICEGFHDPLSLASSGFCAAGNYRMENLVVQASGGNFTGATAVPRWDNILSATLRSDQPQSLGPWPNTTIYASAFNYLAKAVNLLVKVPLYLPQAWESCWKGYQVELPASADVFLQPGPGHPAPDEATLADAIENHNGAAGLYLLRGTADVAAMNAGTDEGGTEITSSGWAVGLGNFRPYLLADFKVDRVNTPFADSNYVANIGTEEDPEYAPVIVAYREHGFARLDPDSQWMFALPDHVAELITPQTLQAFGLMLVSRWYGEPGGTGVLSCEGYTWDSNPAPEINYHDEVQTVVCMAMPSKVGDDFAFKISLPFLASTYWFAGNPPNECNHISQEGNSQFYLADIVGILEVALS